MSDGCDLVLFGVCAKRRKHTRDNNPRTSALGLEEVQVMEEIQPQRTRRCAEEFQKRKVGRDPTAADAEVRKESEASNATLRSKLPTSCLSGWFADNA